LEKLRLSREEIKFKNYFKKACLIKKKLYFCTRFENESSEAQKKERHVHRHIELTAVLKEISKQRKRE